MNIWLHKQVMQKLAENGQGARRFEIVTIARSLIRNIGNWDRTAAARAQRINNSRPPCAEWPTPSVPLRRTPYCGGQLHAGERLENGPKGGQCGTGRSRRVWLSRKEGSAACGMLSRRWQCVGAWS